MGVENGVKNVDVDGVEWVDDREQQHVLPVVLCGGGGGGGQGSRPGSTGTCSSDRWEGRPPLKVIANQSWQK